jgi:hypothetical protein
MYLETPELRIGSTGSTSTNLFGYGKTSDGATIIDLITENTNQYGTRLSRGAGANGITEFVHKGTGDFNIGTIDLSSIYFYVNDAIGMLIRNDGNIGINTASPSEKLTVNGNTLITGNLYVTDGTQSIFSANSSSELIKIIQTGTGDAFVVEDSANNDSSHFVINASGNTAIGLSQPIGNDKLTVSGNTTVYGALSATTVSGDGSGLYNLPFNYGLATAISNFNFLT